MNFKVIAPIGVWVSDSIESLWLMLPDLGISLGDLMYLFFKSEMSNVVDLTV